MCHTLYGIVPIHGIELLRILDSIVQGGQEGTPVKFGAAKWDAQVWGWFFKHASVLGVEFWLGNLWFERYCFREPLSLEI